MLRIAFALLLIAPQAYAYTEHESPQNACYQESCSPQQDTIYTAFKAAGVLGQDQINHVYSGACYFRGGGLTADEAHYAVVALKTFSSTSVHFTGRFSFFYKENPYATWTMADLDRELAPQPEEKSLMRFENDYAWADFNAGQVPIVQYYLRAAPGHLYLVGFWDIKQTMFCDLMAN